VAGWAGGESWITPGLLLERANFARDVLFPSISFLPPDRYTSGGEIRRVAERIREGMDISTATMNDSKSAMAESNMSADRDEDFNTRYGSFRGSQMAIQRVKPIPRDTAGIDLTRMVMNANLKNTDQAVDYLIRRFMCVPPADATRRKPAAFLNKELGTADISAAQTYLEYRRSFGMRVRFLRPRPSVWRARGCGSRPVWKAGAPQGWPFNSAVLRQFRKAPPMVGNWP
jgi:hypothetical protein